MKKLIHIQSVVDGRYALCGVKTNKVIWDYKDKRFIDSTKKQVDDLILEVDKSIEKEYGHEKT